MAPLTDPARLAAIARIDLLDGELADALDRLTRITATALDVPVSLVSLVEPHQQRFAGCIGLAEPWALTRETPISHSFCQHAVVSGEPLVIEDARRHPLVRENPAIEELDVVAYAGIPLRTSDGQLLGTLCAIDREPRSWEDHEIALLSDLAKSVLTEIELRSAKRRATNGGSSAGDPTDQAPRGVNIAALARRTGVGADTLRKWEQRYGILRPLRTRGGQRRYGEADVARVEWLKARLREGYRIGEAAALLGAAPGGVTQTPEELVDSLLDALHDGDARAVERLLDQAFALGETDAALGEIVAPLLERVGEGWAAGKLSVAQEHLISGHVRARLERLLADARGGVRGAAVLACAPGELHELGLLMLAVLLRADGWHVAYLGANTPTGDAVALAAQLDARLLGISATLPDRVAEVEASLGALDLPLGLQVVVGGAGFPPDRARALGARYAGGDLRSAVRALRKLAR